jgi:hypothetical protein
MGGVPHDLAGLYIQAKRKVKVFEVPKSLWHDLVGSISLNRLFGEGRAGEDKEEKCAKKVGYQCFLAFRVTERG